MHSALSFDFSLDVLRCTRGLDAFIDILLPDGVFVEIFDLKVLLLQQYGGFCHNLMLTTCLISVGHKGSRLSYINISYGQQQNRLRVSFRLKWSPSSQDRRRTAWCCR
jgi:hypothetical protein